jgi:hypothetical protein
MYDEEQIIGKNMEKVRVLKKNKKLDVQIRKERETERVRE